MVQRIKVQSGRVIYEATDSTFDLSMDVNGQVNVTKELNVGNDPLVDGTITTPDGADLIIAPGIDGNIDLVATGTGRIILNNSSWPTDSASPGRYLGFTSLNTMAFLDAVLSTMVPSDTYTSAQLDALFGPDVVPGQQAIGPTTFYQKISSGDWRRMAALGYTPVNKAGDTMDGFLILNSDPIDAFGAATKQYVDNLASGIIARPAVLAATTANLIATYYNGPGNDGVGATLTSDVNELWPGIDGVTTGWSIGSGVLVKNQSNPAYNGRYFISDMGSVSTPWVLTRCIYCDTAEEIPGSYIFVQDGTQEGTGWIAVVDDPSTFVVGTDAINWYQFSGSGTYIGGTGIDISSNVISNIGVTSLIAGSNISIDQSTGDITVSVSGSVPSASGLSGGSANQIPYQSPANITTFSPALTFDETTDTFQVGDTLSPGIISAATGQSLTIVSDAAISIEIAAVDQFTVNQTSTVVTGHLIRSIETSISAAGASLGTATPLTKDINEISTVLVNQGVALPNAIPGATIIVVNNGANALNVYPSSASVSIDALPLGSAFSLPISGRIMFLCVSSSQWYTLNATYM